MSAATATSVIAGLLATPDTDDPVELLEKIRHAVNDVLPAEERVAVAPFTHVSGIGWQDAGLEVAYKWHRFSNAPNPLHAAMHMVALSNAVSDLQSWLPGYHQDTCTMPWERDEDES